MLCVITTLEFFQHHFSAMGHRYLFVTQTYLSRQATTAPFERTRSVRRRAALFKRGYRTGVRLPNYTGKWTERSRLPTAGLLTRNNFRVARHLGATTV
jgi:hypothetical protein